MRLNRLETALKQRQMAIRLDFNAKIDYYGVILIRAVQKGYR